MPKKYIPISESVKKQLIALKGIGGTYDSVITTLIQSQLDVNVQKWIDIVKRPNEAPNEFIVRIIRDEVLPKQRSTNLSTRQSSDSILDEPTKQNLKDELQNLKYAIRPAVRDTLPKEEVETITTKINAIQSLLEDRSADDKSYD